MDRKFIKTYCRRCNLYCFDLWGTYCGYYMNADPSAKIGVSGLAQCSLIKQCPWQTEFPDQFEKYFTDNR